MMKITARKLAHQVKYFGFLEVLELNLQLFMPLPEIWTVFFFWIFGKFLKLN